MYDLHLHFKFTLHYTIHIMFYTHALDLSWKIEATTCWSDHFPFHICVGSGAGGNTHTHQITFWNCFRDALHMTPGESTEEIQGTLQKSTGIIRLFAHLPEPELRMCNLLAQKLWCTPPLTSIQLGRPWAGCGPSILRPAMP